MLPEEYQRLLITLEMALPGGTDLPPDYRELKKVIRTILDYIYWENEDHEDER